MTTTLTEDEFYSIYKPKPNPTDDGDFWDRADAQTQPSAHVWTAMDGDDGSTIVVPGWHIVNRFAYMVTEIPWTMDDIEVQFDDPEPRCDICGEHEDHEDGLENDWNGETGNHKSCEQDLTRPLSEQWRSS